MPDSEQLTVFFACPLCQAPLPVLTTKTKAARPYVICNSCALQMFVRNDRGAERLKRLVSSKESLAEPRRTREVLWRGPFCDEVIEVVDDDEVIEVVDDDEG